MAALNSQYSTPGVESHVMVALVSPATTLTLVGAGAEEPAPRQPSKIREVINEFTALFHLKAGYV